MKTLLLPKQTLMVGQDFLVASMQAGCNLSLLLRPAERYAVPSVPPELIVSINPHEGCDADFLQSMFNAAPIVVHLHNQLDYFEGEQRQNVIRSLSLASTIVVPAEFLSRAVKALFPYIPVRVVPNGIPEKLFFSASPDERAAFRLQNGLPPEGFLAGFVGPLTEAKGLQVIRSICRKIGDENFSLFVQYPDWHAVIENVGTTYREIASELKFQSPAKITVWPDQSPRGQTRPIRYFDVLIAPSLSEVQPITAIEALISGVPIIATRATPFYDELLDAGINYLWCRTIPLPERFNKGALEKSRLRLTEEEAATIADDIIGVLRDNQPISDREHRNISGTMARIGFVETAMCNSFSLIYAETIRDFPTRSKELRTLSF